MVKLVTVVAVLLRPLLDSLQFLLIEFEILLDFIAPIVLIKAVYAQFSALLL